MELRLKMHPSHFAWLLVHQCSLSQTCTQDLWSSGLPSKAEGPGRNSVCLTPLGCTSTFAASCCHEVLHAYASTEESFAAMYALCSSTLCLLCKLSASLSLSQSIGHIGKPPDPARVPAFC